VLITLVLVADALIGDKGLLEHRRESRRHAEIRRELEQHRQDNRALRDRARRLREQDPATIEDLARRRLGMIKPGELLFIVKDAERPPSAPPKSQGRPPAR
jgi:cell division protein FtsB